MTKEIKDDAIKRLLERHDETTPQPPAAEWATIRARALQDSSGRKPVRRLTWISISAAAAAMLAITILRTQPESSLPTVDMAAMPTEDEQVEQLLTDDSYYEDLEPQDEGYLALLE